MITVSVKDPEAIFQTAKTLRAGGVILYPTDTVYGLGALASNSQAVETIYRIKERERGKPLLMAACSVEMIERYAVMTSLAHTLSKRWPAPLSLILANKVDPRTSTGWRVPDSQFVLDVVSLLDEPIISTSANISGISTEHTLAGVMAALGENCEHIDLAIDVGTLNEGVPSTLVDARGSSPIILRQGAIRSEEIVGQ